ncbi:MAG: LamG domain-containing protein [Candidatus Liptonbacteria bacterium]|nr:LamG domain-containing protein [Candidatus Liptonbacteria bacterium]
MPARPPTHIRLRGFTLLELLVSLGIVAIISVIVILVLNPAEILRQGRDARRLAELSNLSQAVAFFSSDAPSVALGESNRIYLSVPDLTLSGGSPRSNCDSLISSGALAPLSSPWEYRCTAEDDLRKVNGTGWIPVNFANLAGGSPLSNLPVDPVNNAARGLYYTYVAEAQQFAATAPLESAKHQKEVAQDDGGTDPVRIETGTALSLWAKGNQLVGYWKLDEGSGNTVRDASPTAENGTRIGPTWTPGKSGNALQFDGIDDRVVFGDTALNLGSDNFTITAWVNTGQSAAERVIVSKGGFNSGIYPGYAAAIHNGAIRLRIGDSDESNKTLTTTELVNNNAWRFAAGVFARTGGMRAYIDGVPSATPPVGITTIGTTDNSDDLMFGARDASGGPASFLNGIIDEVRIYRRALTAQEIQALYDATK